mmetsp:Transcript_12071/g.35853  ORF Transcript_12071/g.35853 Transcript_12071/m.35853 type:complete len:1116 (+) Transcript_12071:1498-4845(+)
MPLFLYALGGRRLEGDLLPELLRDVVADPHLDARARLLDDLLLVGAAQVPGRPERDLELPGVLLPLDLRAVALAILFPVVLEVLLDGLLLRLVDVHVLREERLLDLAVGLDHAVADAGDVIEHGREDLALRRAVFGAVRVHPQAPEPVHDRQQLLRILLVDREDPTDRGEELAEELLDAVALLDLESFHAGGAALRVAVVVGGEERNDDVLRLARELGDRRQPTLADEVLRAVGVPHLKEDALLDVQNVLQHVHLLVAAGRAHDLDLHRDAPLRLELVVEGAEAPQGLAQQRARQHAGHELRLGDHRRRVRLELHLRGVVRVEPLVREVLLDLSVGLDLDGVDAASAAAGAHVPDPEHPLGAREVVDLQMRLERGGILRHEGLLEEGQIASVHLDLALVLDHELPRHVLGVGVVRLQLVPAGPLLGEAALHQDGLQDAGHRPLAVEEGVADDDRLAVGHVEHAPLEDAGHDHADAPDVHGVLARGIHKFLGHREFRIGLLLAPDVVPLPLLLRLVEALVSVAHVVLLLVPNSALRHGRLEFDRAAIRAVRRDPPPHAARVPAFDGLPLGLSVCGGLVQILHLDPGVDLEVVADDRLEELDILDDQGELTLLRLPNASGRPDQAHGQLAAADHACRGGGAHDQVRLRLLRLGVLHGHRPLGPPDVEGHLRRLHARGRPDEGRQGAHQDVAHDGVLDLIVGLDREAQHGLLGIVGIRGARRELGRGSRTHHLRAVVRDALRQRRERRQVDRIRRGDRVAVRVEAEEGCGLLAEGAPGGADQRGEELLQAKLAAVDRLRLVGHDDLLLGVVDVVLRIDAAGSRHEHAGGVAGLLVRVGIAPVRIQCLEAVVLRFPGVSLVRHAVVEAAPDRVRVRLPGRDLPLQRRLDLRDHDLGGLHLRASPGVPAGEGGLDAVRLLEHLPLLQLLADPALQVVRHRGTQHLAAERHGPELAPVLGELVQARLHGLLLDPQVLQRLLLTVRLGVVLHLIEVLLGLLYLLGERVTLLLRLPKTLRVRGRPRDALLDDGDDLVQDVARPAALDQRRPRREHPRPAELQLQLVREDLQDLVLVRDALVRRAEHVHAGHEELADLAPAEAGAAPEELVGEHRDVHDRGGVV